MQSHPHQIIGYHSCDKSVGLKVLSGKMELIPSTNDWDWLGHGTYFWEDNPIRALEYAEEVASGSQFNKSKIKTPFVLGAIIQLGSCLNLLSPDSVKILKESYDSIKEILGKANLPMPENSANNRALDCFTIRAANMSNDYDTVRTAFDEGEEIYPGTQFTTRHHIQVCVRNQDCIKGYFLPRPLKQFNKNI